MKKILYILPIILFTITSCIKDIDFNYNEVETQVVVNALFSENEPWNVLLTYTKATEDTTDRYIDNALVTICSANEEISLVYAGDGEYTSENYPKTGTTYTINIEVPGFEMITATSSVPRKPQCEIELFDTIWTKYMFPNQLLDYEVMPFTINLGNTNEQYYKFGFYGYRLEYKYYITLAAIGNMREKGIPEDILGELNDMLGQYYDYDWFISDCVYHFSDKYNWEEIDNFVQIVRDEILKERKDYDPDRLFRSSTFSNCDWLGNVSSCASEIIGENNNRNTAEIFFGDSNLAWAMQAGYTCDNEYWLRVETCSPEFYKYYKTYVLQVTQRMNPYAETIKVYSNITNGLGIFAGYNLQMIHFFDY